MFHSSGKNVFVYGLEGSDLIKNVCSLLRTNRPTIALRKPTPFIMRLSVEDKYSTTVVWLIFVVLIFIRWQYLNWNSPTVSGTLTWDVFGYYLYLPGEFIYHDVAELKWLKGIVEMYRPTSDLYQVCALPNGHFAMKYLLGMSILYSPFFFLGHLAAGWLGYPQDGFSAPYQLAICMGALLYALLGLMILRRVLRRFFSDGIAAITLLLVALTTNYPQYVSRDSGQTHGFLFAMYALVLWNIVRWCENPSGRRAFWLGLLIGLSCITRPTEGVMLFLALLWRTTSEGQEHSIGWLLWHRYRPQLWLALAGGFLGILPQLLYWKRVTDHWIFDVGSSWRFLTPHWQVLFGEEKGWFVYTPVTVLFVVGLFLMKGQPYRRAVRTFFILNTWIIIAWADWRYGASYSCRALLQGCAVLALPLGLVVERSARHKFRYLLALGGAFLTYANLFQIWQYNRAILHINDNNFAYYRAIFLDPNPTPLDMSLLDTREILRDTSDWTLRGATVSDSVYRGSTPARIWSKPLKEWSGYTAGQEHWLLVSAQVHLLTGAPGIHLITRLQEENNGKQTACRLETGISNMNAWNEVKYWFNVPAETGSGVLSIEIDANGKDDLEIKTVEVKMFGPRLVESKK